MVERIDPVEIWPSQASGVVTLPSGRQVRGRSWRLEPDVVPDYGLYFVHKLPPARVGVDHPSEEALRWDHHLVYWRDFWLPRASVGLRDLLRDALDRSQTQRVELCCAGGKGRTGTAMACLAILDGVPADEAVRWTRAHYRPEAIEMPWQKWYISRFG